MPSRDRESWFRKGSRVAAAIAAIAVAGCDGDFFERFGTNFQISLLTRTDNTSCGTIEIAPLIPDCPVPGVCFTSACDNHNDCYSTCGASKGDCDTAFFRDMIDACSEGLRPSVAEFAVCRWAAVAYWLAVDRIGQDAFDETQLLVCPPGPGDVVEVLGACCLPGDPPVCGDLVPFLACPAQGVFFNDLFCNDLDRIFGGCPLPPNDDCENARLICFGNRSDPNLGRCEGGEELLGGGVCDVSLQDCANGQPCLPVQNTAYRCTVDTDNRLASTDGPDAAGECTASGVDSFQADVWYEFVAPCSGTMVVQMCGSATYDAMLAVYGPGTADAGCICPEGNELLLGCNDDYCGFAATTSGVTVENVRSGACYTIRVGSWAMTGTEETSQRGVSEIDIGVFCEPAEGEGSQAAIRAKGSPTK